MEENSNKTTKKRNAAEGGNGGKGKCADHADAYTTARNEISDGRGNILF